MFRYELMMFDGGWDLAAVADGVIVSVGATFFDEALAQTVVRLLNDLARRSSSSSSKDIIPQNSENAPTSLQKKGEDSHD